MKFHITCMKKYYVIYFVFMSTLSCKIFNGEIIFWRGTMQSCVTTLIDFGTIVAVSQIERKSKKQKFGSNLYYSLIVAYHCFWNICIKINNSDKNVQPFLAGRMSQYCKAETMSKNFILNSVICGKEWACTLKNDIFTIKQL